MRRPLARTTNSTTRPLRADHARDRSRHLMVSGQHPRIARLSPPGADSIEPAPHEVGSLSIGPDGAASVLAVVTQPARRE